MNVDTQNLKPVGTYLLIKVENKTRELEKGGILLSEGAAAELEKGKDKVAEVVSVGTTCTLQIEAGHEVLFRPMQVEAIKVAEHEDGSDLVLVPEHAIMAITNYGV